VVNEQGEVMGAEALVRWMHPQRGMVSPGEFIPLAEQTGLILPLGRLVLRLACNSWRCGRQPRTAALERVGERQRARSFGTPILCRRCWKSCKSRRRPEPAQGGADRKPAAARRGGQHPKMQALRTLGVGFSLDDFGTGYSSLSYLKRLPLDQLKIDQSFVRDVLTDPNDAAIACTIMALAHSLGLEVVAEGVETPGQRDFLLRNGCRSFQGYLFGRPGPVELLYK
jgi:EAL domain-containing protein (putative c-di-GMP-specific phosphodiesterase class I)